MPAVVVHISPLIGVVGATPGAILKPDEIAVDAAELISPVITQPVTMHGAAPR